MTSLSGLGDAVTSLLETFRVHFGPEIEDLITLQKAKIDGSSNLNLKHAQRQDIELLGQGCRALQFLREHLFHVDSTSTKPVTGWNSRSVLNPQVKG